jgi:hypothetical protein
MSGDCILSNGTLVETALNIVRGESVGISPDVALRVLPGLDGNDAHDLLKIRVGTLGNILVDHRPEGVIATRKVSQQVVLRHAGPIEFP